MARVGREAVRPWIPPAALALWRRRRGTYAGLQLTELDWSEAARSCGGYDDPVILDSVEQAARQALESASAYERDGVVFDRGDVHWPILGPLFEARAAVSGELRVVDVGGSLASKWFQHAQFHDALSPIAWAVVEQAALVRVALPWLQTDQLTFHESIESAVTHLGGVDIVLFSSSLQYLEDPMSSLELAAKVSRHSVAIDRMPSWDHSAAALAIQSVGLYSKPVRYPCWVMSKPQVLSALAASFDVVATWQEPMPFPALPESAGIGWLGAAGIGRRA
jgi:putative methyltransferase (TIGR04325 family)